MVGDGDVEAIMASGDFDVAVTFDTTVGLGAPTVVATRGIFTDATQQANVLTNEIEAVNPTIACATSAISTVRNRHTATIDGIDYTVERIERLGTGVSLVHLKTT